MLKITTKGEKEKDLKQQQKRLGKLAKRKGGQYERDIAKKFGERYDVELKRTPQSGGFSKKSDKADDFRGDVTIVDNRKELLLHIECKSQKTLSIPKWILQAESDCPEGRTPIVVFHQYGTSKDYVCLSIQDFFKLVERDKIVRKREFKND